MMSTSRFCAGTVPLRNKFLGMFGLACLASLWKIIRSNPAALESILNQTSVLGNEQKINTSSMSFFSYCRPFPAMTLL